MSDTMSKPNTQKLGSLLKDKGYIRGPFGSALKRGDMVKQGIPVYEQKNAIYNEREFRYYITQDKFEKLKRFQVQANDLIISCSGTVGKISIIQDEDPKGIISQALLILRPDITKITLKFLFYFLSSKQGFKLITQVSHGSVQINIAARKIVETIPVPTPDLSEQKAIAEVLSSLDDKIDLLHRQNQTLEAMAETLFRQWFIEEAKDDWKEVELCNIAKFKNGKSRPKTEGQIPIYGGNGILGYSSEFNADGKSIIIGRVGAYCGSLYYEDDEVWVSDNAILAKGVSIEFVHFLFFLLKTHDLNSMAEGSSHPLLTQTLLKTIIILLPPLRKLQKFHQEIELFRKKQRGYKEQIKTLENLRDTLLPKLMSGEVRVAIK
jgi:type I restriction enzyme S subunit